MKEIQKINEQCRKDLKIAIIGVIIADLIVLIASFCIIFL